MPPKQEIEEIGVALVGSSGGGVATLQTDPFELFRSIHEELGKVHSKNRHTRVRFVLKHALFISLSNGYGMDFANDFDRYATLFAVNCDPYHRDCDNKHKEEKEIQDSLRSRQVDIKIIKYGTLKEVNEVLCHLDDTIIGKSIMEGKVKGLISISSDPLGVNRKSFEAASKMSIPCTGSGGTSLAIISEKYGVNLVGNAGGSVATSIYTKAVSFCYALASAHHYQYSPFIRSLNKSFSKNQKPKLKSILESCLPVFIAVCMLRRLIEVWLVSEDNMETNTALNEQSWPQKMLWLLKWHTLPSICCIVSAHTYASEHGSVAIMAGALASIACSGSVLGGIVIGRVVAYCISRSMFLCIKSGIPVTMTNIIVAGGVGSMSAVLLSTSRLIPFLSIITQIVRNILHAPLPKLANVHIHGIGFLFGCCFCHGSKVGYYHSLYLPVILIEMERGSPSLWGSIDECTLVLVSAGICAANLLYPVLETNKSGSKDSRVSLCKRGLLFNIFCGDFIEVAYPFMERSNVTNVSAYIASGVGAEIIYYKNPHDVLSTAYLPLPVSIWLANDRERLSAAYAAAFIIAFVGSIVSNVVGRYSHQSKEKQKMQ